MSVSIARAAVLGVIAGALPYLATYYLVCPIIFA